MRNRLHVYGLACLVWYEHASMETDQANAVAKVRKKNAFEELQSLVVLFNMLFPVSSSFLKNGRMNPQKNLY